MSIRRWECRLAFIYGFLGTMPILIVAGFTMFSWMSILAFVFSIYDFLRAGYCIHRHAKPILLLTLLSVITAFLCLSSDLPSMWKEPQFKGIFWLLINLFIFIYYARNRNLQMPEAYIKGVYYGAVFQMIWGYLQFVLFHIANIKLNDVVFLQIFHLNIEYATHMKDGNIALSGLCWHVANMAPLLLFGFVYSESKYLKLAFAVCSMLSGSRTCLIGIAAAILFPWMMKSKIFKINKRQWVYAGAMIAVGALLIFLGGYNRKAVEVLVKIKNSFSRETLLNQGSAMTHIRYWTSIPQIMQNAKLENLLFGFGIGCSGYPFAAYLGQYADELKEAWVVECDFVNLLWSYGILSLIVCVVWYGKYFILSKEKQKVTFFFLLAFFIEGITYNVIFNWCQIMLFCMFIMLENGREIRPGVGSGRYG